ncbi:hypothetical protein HNQ48_000891 [Melissococcus plutonius]|nr:hypothetical protein [Melissococcus plutonius]
MANMGTHSFAWAANRKRNQEALEMGTALYI